MNATRAYRARPKSERSEQTRERITAAVRELLAEGSFHTSRVEEVAKRARVSRATVYQHFHSRLDLVDEICDTFALNPALVRLRQTVTLEDPDAALTQTIALSMRFWDTEDSTSSTASLRSTPPRTSSSGASARTAAAKYGAWPVTCAPTAACAPASASAPRPTR
jgi:AcrR family transcriptional regulator